MKKYLFLKNDLVNIYRAKRVIEEIIKGLKLDLKGLTILTEVGSNLFALTPIICAIAGAKTIYAWTRDSRFGAGIDNVKQCRSIQQEMNLQNIDIQFAINERPNKHIQEAHIITNLGFVRPLDNFFLQNVNPRKTVISLMCEAWELRKSDIDIDYCKQNNISVAGTWEDHPSLEVFQSTGKLAVKMALEAGYEVYQNNILIWSNDSFGKVAYRAFLDFGANRVMMTTSTEVLMKNLAKLDFIYVCDYDEERAFFSNKKGEGIWELADLKKINPSIGIVHLYGSVDVNFLSKNHITVFPEINGKPKVMTKTLAHLGLVPLIRLHAGGLSVGQMMLEKQESNLIQTIC